MINKWPSKYRLHVWSSSNGQHMWTSRAEIHEGSFIWNSTWTGSNWTVSPTTEQTPATDEGHKCWSDGPNGMFYISHVHLGKTAQKCFKRGRGAPSKITLNVIRWTFPVTKRDHWILVSTATRPRPQIPPPSSRRTLIGQVIFWLAANISDQSLSRWMCNVHFFLDWGLWFC